MKRLIIIPAYNEGENIKKTVDNIIESAPNFDYIFKSPVIFLMYFL